MSNFLEKFTSPLVALGWVAVVLLVIMFINILTMFNSIFASFRDTLWQNFNIPAVWAFVLFTVSIPIFVISAWFVINATWIIANKTLIKVQNW